MANLSVGEMAGLTGVSVRTLHHYDAIGLLKPSLISEAGYRYYGGDELERMQEILFYRELDFSLKEIKAILSMPGYDRRETFRRHKKLLVLKKQRLERLIGLVDDIMKGEDKMDFTAFDAAQIDAARAEYACEARERWGKTAAYRQYGRKTAAYGQEQWKSISEEADMIFRQFAAKKDLPVSHPEIGRLVAAWREHITKYYYDCTKEILAGLGRMYAEDERFARYIDRWGKGTAAFLARAIEDYCGK